MVLLLAKNESPDVIILDLMMPEMDGYQVCNAIRPFSSVPILILSAFDMPGMVSKALDAGADDYLIKPVASSILIAHLNNLVRRANAPIMNGSVPQESVKLSYIRKILCKPVPDVTHNHPIMQFFVPAARVT